MTVGLAITAFTLGLRHGVDWDHLAAIADLSSSASSRRRGLVLSFIYALGHAAVILVLGAAAIAVGATLPDSVERWSGRVVGLTLIALGLWILVELGRKGRDFRLRSRWMLVLGGTFAGLRRVRQARTRRRLSVTHTHPHSHPHAHTHPDAELEKERADVQPEVGSQPIGVDGEAGPAGRGGVGTLVARALGRSHGHTHSHPHTHDLDLADHGAEPGGEPSNGAAAGVGLLHGIGVESPTQIAIFVASTSATSTTAGLSLLVAWVLGLVVANSGLALLAAGGLLRAERYFTVYATVAVLVAVASVAMGVLLLVGLDVLPELANFQPPTARH